MKTSQLVLWVVERSIKETVAESLAHQGLSDQANRLKELPVLADASGLQVAYDYLQGVPLTVTAAYCHDVLNEAHTYFLYETTNKLYAYEGLCLMLEAATEAAGSVRITTAYEDFISSKSCCFSTPERNELEVKEWNIQREKIQQTTEGLGLDLIKEINARKQTGEIRVGPPAL